MDDDTGRRQSSATRGGSPREMAAVVRLPAGRDRPGRDVSASRAAGRAHDAHSQTVATSFAPLVAMGNDILKAIALINGLAAAATLWLVASALRDRPDLALPLVLPLALFGFGLTVAGCATGFSYFSHERHAQALALQARISAEPFVIETDASRAAAAEGERFRAFAMRAVFVAIGSAVLGFGLAGFVLLSHLR